MPCYQPVTGYRFSYQHSALLTPNGKYKVFFDPHVIACHMSAFGQYHEVLTLPCGTCTGCLLKRSQEWSLRVMLEARYWKSTCFLTLTYSDEKLPPTHSLIKQHFQQFMKRLRMALSRDHERWKLPEAISKIKYYMVGEYGGTNERPHYHALLFGFGFPDKVPVRSDRATEQLYASPMLDELWGHGMAWIGSVTEKSAAYCARYSLKKSFGAAGEEKYAGRQPPYNCMSKGIGESFLAEFTRDVYPSDHLIHPVTRKPVPIPRYFDKKFAQQGEKQTAELAAVKSKRQQRKRKESDFTPERLFAREQAVKVKLSVLKRNLGDPQNDSDCRQRS